MIKRCKISLAARSIRAYLLFAIALGSFPAAALAQEREHAGSAQEASPTSTATPAALKPVVLIAGGTGYIDRPTGETPGVLSSAEIYDPALHQFLPIAAMKERRDQFTAVAIGIDRVLLVGGINTLLVPLNVFPGPAMPWILRSAEIFNSGDGKFVAAASMKYSRDDPTATTLQNDKVLIVGGDSPTAELYDPSSNTFAETGAMASSRHGQTATLLRNGSVLIAGGGFLKVEVYDPATGKFQFAGKLDDNRLYHTATLLADGLVLIAGGCPFARSSAVDTSEIFDEVGQTVSAGPKMTQSRAGHTATLLGDGRVLIAGGRGDKSSEFYDPEIASVRRGTRDGRSSFRTFCDAPAGRNRAARGRMGSGLQAAFSSAEIFDPVANRFVTTGEMTEARAGHSATLIFGREPITWILPTPSVTPTPSTTPTDTLTPTPSGTRNR